MIEFYGSFFGVKATNTKYDLHVADKALISSYTHSTLILVYFTANYWQDV